MPPVFASGAQIVDGAVVLAAAPGDDMPPQPAPESPVVDDAASAQDSPESDVPPEPADSEPGQGDEDEPEAEEQLVLPPTNRGQRRFVSNLIRENERSKQELAQLRQQNAVLIQRLAVPPQAGAQPPERPPELPMGPRRDDFPDETSFIDAVVDHKMRQREAQQVVQQKSTVWQQRMASGVQQYADYDAVISNPAANPSASLSPVLFEAVCDSEYGHELLYALGRDLALLHRLNTMTPTAAAREIGRLEEHLQSQRQQPPPAPPTRARQQAPLQPPAPLRQPVAGGGAPAPTGGFRPGMALQDYETMRRTQNGRR